MTKVYELVYNEYGNDCGYYHVAASLDKTKLQALIDKAKEFDKHSQAELQKFETLDDYDIEWGLPSDFPLLLCQNDWFDEDDFFENHYDGDCTKNFEILERQLL
ncbi:Uncharacterised protein [Moraxella lacunata]|uniref:Uncharacterized protein n=1 Tax=Moraxella lacunata TaxID=477 RepID=A0A378T428_MORLA|nr:hypothetical protein [Moraxella lacunata]STZ55562.1 Uncharacterised protein [Moraxella lacunata]